MIFPIGDDQVKGGHKGYISYTFIVLNVLVFLYQLTLPIEACSRFLLEFGVRPVEITAGVDYFTLITSMFVHGGWMHLIGNMVFLWVFGDNIEAIIGPIRFTLFYLAGGICAALVHIYFNLGSSVPTVGASGAIAAVLGAYIVMFPKSQIRLIIIFFFITFRIPAVVFLGFWIIQQLFNGIGGIGGTTAHTGGVAWWAHIGGFAFGLISGLMIRWMFDTSLDQRRYIRP